MKKFTHGIMAVDPLNENDEMVAIVHFIGLWQEPTEEEILQYAKEIKTNPKFGHTDIANRLVILQAPPEIVEIYYNMANEHEISKLN
jgi:predicted nuclease of predicted toxin-antitoxin system